MTATQRISKAKQIEKNRRPVNKTDPGNASPVKRPAAVHQKTANAIYSSAPIVGLGNPAKTTQTQTSVQGGEVLNKFETLWLNGSKDVFFEELRNLRMYDPDVYYFIGTTLRGDERWLALHIMVYGTEEIWPVYLLIELEMRHFELNIHGIHSRCMEGVYEILRNFGEYSKDETWQTLLSLYNDGTINGAEFFYALSILVHGPEENWTEAFKKIAKYPDRATRVSLNMSIDPGDPQQCQAICSSLDALEIPDSGQENLMTAVPSRDAIDLEPTPLPNPEDFRKGVEITVIDEKDVVGMIGIITSWETVWKVDAIVSSVEDMVNKVIKAAKGFQIYRLNIHGHGKPGSQSVGIGEESDKTNTKEINYRNIKKLRPILARLTPHFTADALVTLYGCNVAYGRSGTRLLKRLAKIWGVPVRGGVKGQTDIFSGLEGPQKTCYPPNGGISQECVTVTKHDMTDILWEKWDDIWNE